MKLSIVTIFSVIFLFEFGSMSNKANFSSDELKIIGGQYAAKGEFPYTIALVTHARCGGTLVKFNTIITAASCFYKDGQKIEASTVKVIAGALGLEDPKESGYQESKLASFKTHENYTGDKSSGDDIALGTLAKAFNPTTYVKLAQYAARTPKGLKEVLYTIIEEDTSCVALGWGDTGAFITDSVSGGSEKLKMVDVKVLPQRECQTAPGMALNEVCISTRRSADKGITNGDSGTTFACQGDFFGLNKGPLKYKVNEKEYDGAVVTLIWPYVKYFGLELSVATPNKPANTFKVVLLLIFIVQLT